MDTMIGNPNIGVLCANSCYYEEDEKNDFVERLSELERVRVTRVLDAPFAGLRPKHTWIAPKQAAVEAILQQIDPDGWREWLNDDLNSYPPVFGINVREAYSDVEVGQRAARIERNLADVASAIGSLGSDDFAYYTKDADGLLIPEESESCMAAYADTFRAYDYRRKLGLKSKMLLHADIPTELHRGETPRNRPFSALLNIGVIRKAIAKRLVDIRNSGHTILPPGYIDEARLILSPPFLARRLESIAESTLVDFQVLVGSTTMPEYKTLKIGLLDDDRNAAHGFQESMWKRTGMAFMIIIAPDGRILEYASPPSARELPATDLTERDVCREQAAVPLIIDGRIQCTVVVGAFLRGMLELEPSWLYINCGKDSGDLEKAGNAASYISAIEWTKSGLAFVPDRNKADIVYVGSEQRKIIGILPEIGYHRGNYGRLDEVYEDDIFPRFSEMMSRYEISSENIYRLGNIEDPAVRAHVMKEMRLSRRLPVITADGELIRRYENGELESELKQPQSNTLSLGAVDVSKERGTAAAPCCTVGGGPCNIPAPTKSVLLTTNEEYR